MTMDSFLKENSSGFKIGQIVDARSRLWRIERIISKKSEFEKNSEINLLEVASIDGVPNRLSRSVKRLLVLSASPLRRSAMDLRFLSV